MAGLDRFMRRSNRAALLGLLTNLTWILATPAQDQPRIKIHQLDQLPRHDYEISCTLEELLKSPFLFKDFASRVRSDLETELKNFEILDKTTLEHRQATLVTLDLMDGRYDSALAGLSNMRELQDKPARIYTSGLLDRPLAMALEAAGGDTGKPVFKSTFRHELTAGVGRLPREIVQDEVEQMKGVLELFNEEMLLGLVNALFAPAVEKSGSISLDLAIQVINVWNFLNFTLPIKEDAVAILANWIEAGGPGPADIWTDRSRPLSPADGGRPVVVAIWDTGIDVGLYRDILFTNTRECLDGRDTDGNGYIDDVHGIAYDLNWRKTEGLLYPLGEAKTKIDEFIGLIKGYFDLQASVDSPEAADLKARCSSLTAGEVGPLLEDLTRCAIYVHGTHVAGLAAQGNPFIRLLTTRLEPDYRSVPARPTIETARRAAAAFAEIIAYYKKNDVRIVNMSWGIELREIERQLEKNGFGPGAGERAAEARRIFEIMSVGLWEAIESAPAILFVAAAGNSDADVDFEEFCPASFELPNLLTAGAVDRTGRETSFTCFGDRIRIYSNGFEVVSRIPGGRRLAFSGTSMAAPQVVNLAAKILALEPSLSPPDVIELIVEGATPGAGSKQLLLIHPKRTLELLEERQAVH